MSPLVRGYISSERADRPPLARCADAPLTEPAEGGDLLCATEWPHSMSRENYGFRRANA